MRSRDRITVLAARRLRRVDCEPASRADPIPSSSVGGERKFADHGSGVIVAEAPVVVQRIPVPVTYGVIADRLVALWQSTGPAPSGDAHNARVSPGPARNFKMSPLVQVNIKSLSALAPPQTTVDASRDEYWHPDAAPAPSYVKMNVVLKFAQSLQRLFVTPERST